MGEPLVIFKAVSDETQKQMLLQKFLSSNEPIYLRDSSDNSIALKPVSFSSSWQLKCQPLENTDLITPAGTIFIANFALNDDKYIFETRPVVENNHVTLPVLNLFYLQRRRNFRYVLPEDYSAEFVVSSLNQVACSQACRLLDLSTEGCAVRIPQAQANFNREDIISAEIILGHQNPISVQGTIKNIRIKDETYFVLGIEFDHVANSSEEKIIRCLTDLQRDIYFRRAS